MKALQMPFAMNWWNSLTTDKKKYYTKKYLDNKDSNTLTVFEILYLHKKSSNN